jgi:hypothetical protein
MMSRTTFRVIAAGATVWFLLAELADFLLAAMRLVRAAAMLGRCPTSTAITQHRTELHP